MKPHRTWGMVVAAILIALAAGVGVAREWSETQALRAEVELARTEAAALGRLRNENQSLRAQQLPPAELARLRADHAALPRLRSELEALKARADFTGR